MFYKKETVFMEHTLLKHERERRWEGWGKRKGVNLQPCNLPSAPSFRKLHFTSGRNYFNSIFVGFIRVIIYGTRASSSDEAADLLCAPKQLFIFYKLCASTFHKNFQLITKWSWKTVLGFNPRFKCFLFVDWMQVPFIFLSV